MKVIPLLLILFALFFLFRTPHSRKPEIILNDTVFSVEVADTEIARERGLSGHHPLSDREGMLVIFPKPDIYGFWMKDMNFPIDIIWFDRNWTIISLEKSVATSTYPHIFYPSSPAMYVLEVKSGISDFSHFKVGDVALHKHSR